MIRGVQSGATPLAALLVGSVAGLLSAATASAQVDSPIFDTASVIDMNQVDAGGDGEPSSTPAAQGFSVRKADAPVTQALEDFVRYRDKKAWEKAFRVLEQQAELHPVGMVPAEHGFWLPYSKRVMQLLRTLPPEGRAAYRLFNDAKARQLLEPLDKGQLKPSEEVALLERVVTDYFITSVGDRAADRLGDAYFERGDFATAERAWRFILDCCPDTGLSELRLQIKRGTALARLGKNAEVSDLARALQQRYGDKTLTIGGQEVRATAYLASLARAAPSEAAREPATASEAADAALPQEETPAWQVRFLGESTRNALAAALANNPFDMSGLSTFVPPAAHDGRRLYCNWLGVCFAVDLTTGKLLWRSDKFSALQESNRLQQFFFQYDVNRYALTLAASRLLVTIEIPMSQFNSGDVRYRLVCRWCENGATAWTSKSLSQMGEWNFAGRPLIVGERIYIAAHKHENTELCLLALELGTGKLCWELPLGATTAGQNRFGRSIMPQPDVILERGMLYVVTHNGALLAVNPDRGSLEWAFTCEPPRMMNMNGPWSWNPGLNPPRIEARGGAIVRDGVIYFKETGGRAVYAVDPAGPALLWKRPADAEAALAGIDERRIFLLSDSLSAFDRLTPERKLLWSTSLPVKTGSLQPILAGERCLVLTARGIFEISTAQGDRKIFRGADSSALGGALLLAGRRLVGISNQAITAYDLPLPAAEEHARMNFDLEGNR